MLMLYYKALRKKIVLTAHNVNTRKRDREDTRLNRLTLRIQYRLADNIFVHTENMKRELIEEFGVEGSRVTVIPFGINNAVPTTRLTPAEARQRLGIPDCERTILFFGRIAPRKGLEYLIAAFHKVLAWSNFYHLIIAGRPERCETYWTAILEAIRDDVQRGRVLLTADFIPDDKTESTSKRRTFLCCLTGRSTRAASCSWGTVSAYPFWLLTWAPSRMTSWRAKPVSCSARKSRYLARVIEQYFASDLYADLNNRRKEIREHATRSHSWDTVSQATMTVYAGVLHTHGATVSSNCDVSSTS